MSKQLFYGDNLEVLRKYIKDESVDLCYIDPPFNSKRNYNQIYNNLGKEDRGQAQAFIDTWTWDDRANQGLVEIQENYLGSFTSQSIDLISGLVKVLGKGSLLAYLISMTLRIAEINRILKPTGSFYLHCDPTASHYLKIIIDAIFCPQAGQFQNEIVWCYSIGGKSKDKFGRKHDIILFYTKGKKYTFNRKGASIARKQNSHMKVRTDSEGREYQEKKNKKTGKIYQYYLDEGKIAEDYWVDIETLNREDRERLGYPTQKPEALLERIIKTSSNEGDLILDAYCGCGTTIAVAERFNRVWIGIDMTYQSIGLILKRLEDNFGKNILDTIVTNGIPKDIESAKALATKKDDRTRKEFEKWSILTYSNNRAVINAKKGADRGIDAIAYFQGDRDSPEKIIFQVKSGKVKSGDIRELQGTMSLQQAEIGIFITLNQPTKDMLQTAKSAGIYQSRYMSQSIDKIQIISITEILEEKKRLDIRLAFDVLKSAEKQRETKNKQLELKL
ncbi:DNA methyltransferase [Spirulina sp. 06S082]|uniref:DNA methyltransferase n=1 Tax=Spirulina sp. 06S082 TaxID=3110248 RepID=UPI002B1F299F|nr:DNA methyltransferase [Spirulina sp. 06S082]MEA5470973.1 DNA methyltransferase [Spirulina sp. 06S082]